MRSALPPHGRLQTMRTPERAFDTVCRSLNMRRVILFVTLFVTALSGGLTGFAPNPPERTAWPAEQVKSWLSRRALRLEHVEAGHGFDDLRPFRDALRDARIVGLGEATHGTREF